MEQRSFFSNHNMSDVELLSDQLLMLKDGKTVLSGTVQEIRESYGRTRIYLESPISDQELLTIPGVISVNKQSSGRSIKLLDAKVGREIFQKVAGDGYVQAFVQAPPSLDEIFRLEVAEKDEEKLKNQVVSPDKEASL